MQNNNETNLEKFIDILIKMVESNEKHCQQGIDEIKAIVKLQGKHYGKEVNHVKNRVLSCEKQISNIKTDLGDAAIETAIKNTNMSSRNKFLLAMATLMITISPLIIKFNKEIIAFFIKCIK